MNAKENKTVWLLDPVHTKVRFESKYLLITSVSGWFTELEGSVVAVGEDFEDSQIQVTIYTKSLYTGIEERDKHLRSTDFLNTAVFPTITFQSIATTISSNKVSVQGNLCMKDITTTIGFDAILVGTTRDPLGNIKAGFEMNIILSRKDLGLSWNHFFDKSGILLADEVCIHGDIQLLKVI